MNYQELRTYFRELLNRDDCTDGQADQFIQMGLRRTERVLRTPIQRRTFSYTVPAEWDGRVPIPPDYLGIHQITHKGIVVPRITVQQEGLFEGWSIKGAYFAFNGPIHPGDDIQIEYYNEFTRSPGIGITTNYSLVLTDIIVYAALVYAADFFIDMRKENFSATFAGLAQEVQLMADMDEMAGTGMVIMPYGGGIV
jgi:hypothetical protein